MRFKLIQRFLQLESSSGLVLLFTAMLAMIWANSPFAFIHQQFIDTFLFWINEGLMSVFFLVVGLELKRGYLEGEFSQLSQIMLPGVAALGGMLIPALIYLSINYSNPMTLKGWATPVATDIAFALGVLSLFGKRIPVGLKLFLMALAIFDDIGAIIIIAFFYTLHLSILWFIFSVLCWCVLFYLNRKSTNLTAYLLVGVILWFCLLRAGIHPTIGGVLLALMIPATQNEAKSPLHRLENRLHPWAAYVIMPLFALANAGFSLHGLSADILTDGVLLGIMLGLFVGKQIGVFGFSWVFVQIKWAKLPAQTSWLALYGVALLCGIGFTMSLFLGTLSFANGDVLHLTAVRLGVMVGSLLSAFAGLIILSIACLRFDTVERD